MELIRSKPNRTYAGKAKEAENLKDFNPNDYPKYQELDFTGITDLKTGGTKLALYTQLNDSTKVSPILGTHLVYDSLSLKDEFFTCEKNGTSYILKSPSFIITITNAGVVSCEKVKEAKEYVLCKVEVKGTAIGEDEEETIMVSIMFNILREKAQTYTYTLAQVKQRLRDSAEVAFQEFSGIGDYMNIFTATYDGDTINIVGATLYQLEETDLTINVIELA